MNACIAPDEFEIMRRADIRSKGEISIGSARTGSWISRDALESIKTSVLEAPRVSYRRRSQYLAQLWMAREAAGELEGSEYYPPTVDALRAAEIFINSLPEGYLNFRLGLSDGGEINFFFGGTSELFHINIGDDGKLSYFATWANDEFFGDDIFPESFPFDMLTHFADR